MDTLRVSFFLTLDKDVVVKKETLISIVSLLYNFNPVVIYC